jgi:hypothetical protein
MKINTQLVPAFASKLLAHLALGVGFGAAAIAILSAVLPQSALAQSQGSAQQLGDFRTNEPNAFGGSNIGGSGMSLLDLMRNAQGGGPVDPSKFNPDIDTAVEEFRRSQGSPQLQQLNQPPVSPANSDTQSQPTN